MSHSLEENTIAILVIKVEGHQVLQSCEVNMLSCLSLKNVLKPWLELFLELVWLLHRGHKLDFRVDPLDDNVDTLAVQLLGAAELEVGKTLLESLAHFNVLQLFLDQVTGVLDQV